jgi:opacity protein-like surface antigen
MRLVFVIAATTLVCSSVHGRELKGAFSLSPFGGAVMPIADFASTDLNNENAGGATAGFCAGAAMEYGLTENVALGAHFTYNRFGTERDFAPAAIQVDAIDGRWTITEVFGAYVKLLLSAGSATCPYARAGASLGRAKFDGRIKLDLGTDDSEIEIDNSLGLNAGVGIVHMFSPQLGVFVEGSLTHLLTDKKDLDVTRDGNWWFSAENKGDWQWLAVRTGVTLFFSGASAP